MAKRYLLFSFAALVGVAAAAQNLKGYVRMVNNVGVPGVVVSDGDSVTVTDEKGYYEMQSDKRNGYVFYSLPRGYEPALQDGFRPQFWAALRYPTMPALRESHNFTVTKRDNDNYTMILGADSHLARRTGDLKQFKEGFVARLKEEKTAAGSAPIYSMILGDLAWDGYWYAQNYDLQDFMNSCKEYGYPMTLWPVIGNHDNDGATPAGEDCDFLASAPWRSIVSPNYYSFNLGRVHYVVLDDIFYKNVDTGGSYNKGIVGSRNYDNHITPEQFEWLKRDLSYIEDKTAPLVIALHIPVWLLTPTSPFAAFPFLIGSDSGMLAEIVKDFKNVHVVSGHTHYNLFSHPTSYTNIMEHNIAAICATWWWTGYLNGHHVCRDGSPGGYSLWQVEGDKLTWKYKSIEKNGDMQMRLYDMNTVKEYFSTDANAKKMLAKYTARTDYASVADNTVYVNIFAYDNDWKVEAFEGETRRVATRICDEDPFHSLCYDIPRVASSGGYTADFASTRTCHIFKIVTQSADTPVTVRVTDSFGNVYVQSIQRPMAFDLDLESRQVIGDATSIRPVAADGRQHVYDLSGRRMEKPRAGINIVNGRKILSK